MQNGFKDLPEFEQGLIRTILQVKVKKTLHSGFKGKDGKPLPVVPDHALFIADILPVYANIATKEEVKAGLNSLFRKGFLEWGQTINDTYFRVKDGKV